MARPLPDHFLGIDCSGVTRDNRLVKKLDVGNNVAEYVTDCRAEQGENDNYNNRDQNENQRIFDHTLSFFLGCEQHGFHLLSFTGYSMVDPSRVLPYTEIIEKIP